MQLFSPLPLFLFYLQRLLLRLRIGIHTPPTRWLRWAFISLDRHTVSMVCSYTYRLLFWNLVLLESLLLGFLQPQNDVPFQG